MRPDGIPEARHGELLWFEDRGYGVCPWQGQLCATYFERYRDELDGSPIGLELVAWRLQLVDTWVPRGSPLVDVGIGGGAFLEARGAATWGWDVDPLAVAWLRDRCRLWTPAGNALAENLTLWDSLEHMRHPEALLRRLAPDGFAFVTIPAPGDAAHARRYRHWRPGEHFWHWTPEGFKRFAAELGLRVLHTSRHEEELGREDVATFVLHREQ